MSGAPGSYPRGQRIAVVGAGISGLASAYLLSRRHNITLLEAGNYLGGHTNTVDVELERSCHPVDTGFLVFNDRTYPNLIALFAELGVTAHPSDMSFSVSLDRGRLEWAGSNLNTVFAQRRNLVSPSFLSMLRDIARFNGAAERNLVMATQSGCSVGELLSGGGYGHPFRQNYLLPMAAAIWSSATADILRFPAATFLRFCLNHALLQVNNRPQWKTVLGGGREYVRQIAAQLGKRGASIRLSTAVQSIRRHDAGVDLLTDNGPEHFDAVVLATHAPTTLRMLVDADPTERSVLGAVQYQPNVAILHTDPALLPRRRQVWSAWNYLGRSVGTNGRDSSPDDCAADPARPVCVSYLCNQLQPLPFKTPVVVTLNPIAPPAPGTELGRYQYQHPVFDLAAVAAQARVPALQGRRRTWFAGAWTGYGFHEDGLKSALRVAADFDALPDWARI